MLIRNLCLSVGCIHNGTEFEVLSYLGQVCITLWAVLFLRSITKHPWGRFSSLFGASSHACSQNISLAKHKFKAYWNYSHSWGEDVLIEDRSDSTSPAQSKVCTTVALDILECSHPKWQPFWSVVLRIFSVVSVDLYYYKSDLFEKLWYGPHVFGK